MAGAIGMPAEIFSQEVNRVRITEPTRDKNNDRNRFLRIDINFSAIRLYFNLILIYRMWGLGTGKYSGEAADYLYFDSHPAEVGNHLIQQ